MHVPMLLVILCDFWFELCCGHPEFRRQSASQILHIEIAPQGDEASVIGGALKRVHLVSEDSTGHAIFGFPYDR